MTDRFTQVVNTYGPKLEADFGLTPLQAAGFWGNFARETGEFLHYQEIGSSANTGGRGWAQWTAARRVAFLSYCSRNHLDPKSDDASYAYVFVELSGAYKNVVAAVKRCTTIESATTTVERLYEGAGVKAMSQRVALARKALAIRQAGHTASAAPPAKPKPVADKHAVEPKKPVPVVKRAAPVHHSTTKVKAKR